MKRLQIRQGDVLLVAVEKLPPNVNVVVKQEVILAKGEITGHAHRLMANQVLEWEEEGQRYVRVIGQKGKLFHEEHDPISVAVVAPNTTYKVIPQQEWDLGNQWSKIQD